MKRGNALLAETRQGAGDGLSRHANDLRDLIVGQRYLDSVAAAIPESSCDHSRIRRAIR